MSYTTVKGENIYEKIIEKSRFITYSFSVTTPEQAKEYLDKIRKKHSDATHNCYGYKLKDGTSKFSDDGEPSGTAGAPIYEAINTSNLVDLIVVVTRYFGGVKLGAGGLVRAYFNCAKEGLDIAEKQEYIECDNYLAYLSYEDFNACNNFFNSPIVKVKEKEFSCQVKVEFCVKKGEQVEQRLASILNKKPPISRLHTSFEVF